MLPIWHIHAVTVEPHTGASATGDTYGTAVAVTGFLDEVETLTASPAGPVLVAQTRFYCDLDKGASFPVESRVTYGDREMTVKAVQRHDGGALLGPVSHLVVVLQ